MNYTKEYLSYLFGNKKGIPYRLPQSLDWESLSFEESLMFHTLEKTQNQFLQSLDLNSLKIPEIYRLFTYQEYFEPNLFESLTARYKLHFDFYQSALNVSNLSEGQLQSLFDFENNKLTIFAVFSKNRKRPGLLFIKKSNNKFATHENGKVWSIPVLGESSRGLDFRFTNGRTPMGVYMIKGVMPEANNPYEFGIFRRLKIDYATNVSEAFLPKNHAKLHWFKEASLSHLLGRSLFRIHGTGVKNLNPNTSYFPMVRSSGCLTVRELKIGPFQVFKDQRKLLDKLMLSQGLKAEFKSETNIDSLLYVVNFNGKLRHIKFNT